MKEACIAVNRFMRHRFPWNLDHRGLSNPRIGLHRDMQNMVGKLNHAITLGNFNGGKESGLKTKKELLSKQPAKNGKVRELRGTWIDTHDKPMSFNARRFQHMKVIWGVSGAVFETEHQREAGHLAQRTCAVSAFLSLSSTSTGRRACLEGD